MNVEVNIKSVTICTVLCGVVVTLGGIWDICDSLVATRMGVTCFILWMTGILVLFTRGKKDAVMTEFERNVRIMVTAAFAIGALILVSMVWSVTRVSHWDAPISPDHRPNLASTAYVIGFGGLVCLYINRH
jgi:hypothetical protein